MRKTPTSKKTPDTVHRVILSDGKWLRSPNVSNLGLVVEGQSDMSLLGRTAVLAEASAWPLDRARNIASQFDGAYVDRVSVELGTTEHKVPLVADDYGKRLSDWLSQWKGLDGVTLHEKDGRFSGLSVAVFTKHKPRRHSDATVEFLFWMNHQTYTPTLTEVAIPNISTTEGAAILEFQMKLTLVRHVIASFHKAFPET
jgi:hypothetical protein